MEPADTYLCIVPGRGGASDKVFLPFDDDPTLSVILSKAFLLARDTKITDRSIVAADPQGLTTRQSSVVGPAVGWTR